MRFNQTIAENGKRLRRIAALLFALADLAEMAAGRSRAVCLLMLWLIRPCETAAHDYVDKIAPGAAWPPEPPRPATGPAEALRLAQSLRVLAAVLAALAQHCRAVPPAALAPRLFAGLFAAPPMRPACTATVEPLDSS